MPLAAAPITPLLLPKPPTIPPTPPATAPPTAPTAPRIPFSALLSLFLALAIDAFAPLIPPEIAPPIPPATVPPAFEIPLPAI